MIDKEYLKKASNLFWVISRKAKIASEFFDGISTEFSYLSKKDANLDEEFVRLWNWLKSEVKNGYVPSFTLGQIETVLFLKKKEEEVKV